jgi:hypothetical protein
VHSGRIVSHIPSPLRSVTTKERWTLIPLLYQVYWNGKPEVAESFSSWYAGKHAGELIDVGFWGVHHYRSLKGSSVACNLYEISGIDQFAVNAYDRMHTDDPYTASGWTKGTDDWAAKESSSEVVDFTGGAGSRQSVYDPIETIGIVDSGHADADRPTLLAAITSPVISTVRFDAASDEVVRSWYQETERKRLKATNGFVKSRLGRLAAAQHPAPTHPHEKRAYVMISEWTDVGASDSESSDNEVRSRLVDGFELIGNIEVDVFSQYSSVLHPDVWR